jgi:hypothetical protein
MNNVILRTSRLIALTLGVASLGLSGCDQDGLAAGETAFRAGGGGGGTITFNTDNWVSPAARDVYEFNRTGAWYTNSFGFETKLKKVTFTDPQLGVISTDPSTAPNPLVPRVEIATTNVLEVKVYPPAQSVKTYVGAAVVGLELLFNVKYGGSTSYNVKVRVTQHFHDVVGGDTYELTKAHPSNGTLIGPICETSGNGEDNARIYGNIRVDAITGAVVDQPGLFHLACTAGAPGKSSLYGYFPQGSVETFRLVNRVIRADYCADGYPFTFPGNSLIIRDNFSPGQVGQTIPQVLAYATANNAVVEAMWDENGVLCVGTPRVDTLDRTDIICPVKRLGGGTNAYNWQPPACDSFVDPSPSALRIYSLTSN